MPSATHATADNCRAQQSNAHQYFCRPSRCSHVKAAQHVTRKRFSCFVSAATWRNAVSHKKLGSGEPYWIRTCGLYLRRAAPPHMFARCSSLRSCFVRIRMGWYLTEILARSTWSPFLGLCAPLSPAPVPASTALSQQLGLKPRLFHAVTSQTAPSTCTATWC
jgi:hypothetical protein